MNTLKVASLVFVIFASHSSSSNVKNDADIIELQWKQFKVSLNFCLNERDIKFTKLLPQVDFERNYTSDEELSRFELFRDTLDQIKEHNKKFELGKVDVPATLNEYSDWTDDEKRKLLGTPLRK